MRVRLGGTRRTHTRSAPAAAAPHLPAAYDVLDVPAAAGHRVLLQLERLGTPLGPVLGVQTGGPGHERGCEGGGGRLRFLVEAGTTASFLADLKELGWEPSDTDVRTIGMVPAAETPLPAAGSPRWVRPPESDRLVVLPPARLLLGALAYACRHAQGRPGCPRSRTGRPPLWTG